MLECFGSQAFFSPGGARNFDLRSPNNVSHLLNMKKDKTITSREFQHRFANLSSALKPGESIVVTRHGKTLGLFTKAPKHQTAPDYLANLEKLGHSAQVGQNVIEEICDLS